MPAARALHLVKVRHVSQAHCCRLQLPQSELVPLQEALLNQEHQPCLQLDRRMQSSTSLAYPTSAYVPGSVRSLHSSPAIAALKVTSSRLSLATFGLRQTPLHLQHGPHCLGALLKLLAAQILTLKCAGFSAEPSSSGSICTGQGRARECV